MNTDNPSPDPKPDPPPEPVYRYAPPPTTLWPPEGFAHDYVPPPLESWPRRHSWTTVIVSVGVGFVALAALLVVLYG